MVMETRWTGYADRNRALSGGPASFLVRFSGRDRGTLWSAFSEIPRTFRGLEELVSEMEKEMEATGHPAQEPGLEEVVRAAPVWTFRNGAEGVRRGDLQAVTIQVRRRQRGGMQGEVQICGTGWTACFRSGRDLVSLLRTAAGPGESFQRSSSGKKQGQRTK
jgi:hypothetical protein